MLPCVMLFPRTLITSEELSSTRHRWSRARKPLLEPGRRSDRFASICKASSAVRTWRSSRAIPTSHAGPLEPASIGPRRGRSVVICVRASEHADDTAARLAALEEAEAGNAAKVANGGCAMSKQPAKQTECGKTAGWNVGS